MIGAERKKEARKQSWRMFFQGEALTLCASEWIESVFSNKIKIYN
jgi:hypothetical protein